MTDFTKSGLGIADVVGNKRAEILALAAAYGASSVRVFGSIARGEGQPDSDLDLLMTFTAEYTLRDLIRLTQALRALIGRPVEIVDEAVLRDEVRPFILRDATPL